MNLNWNITGWTNRPPSVTQLAAALKQKAVLNTSVLLLDLLKLRINCRLRLLQFKMFRLCFRRGIRLLFVRCKINFRLFPHHLKLVARHGPSWRGCVFDREIVQLLKFEREVNALASWPDREAFPSSDGNG